MKTRLIAGVAVLGALITVLTTSPVGAASVQDPATDPFYVAPANLASLAPGTVIRHRTVKVNLLSSAVPMPATSQEILVRSNDSHGQPAAVSATVVTPLVGVRHELLAYQMATDSLGAKCEPSYTLRSGTEKEAAVVALAVASGLTVVVPDHEGPRNAYAAGRMAGHAVLDSIRGALALPTSKLTGAGTEVGMMGYSGGAIATGWAAQLQPTYAPELDVVGIASGGTPADLEAAGGAIDGSAFGGLFMGAAIGMSREYPELRSILNAKGVAFADTIKDDCVTGLASHPFVSIKQFSDSPDPLRTPVAQAVLADNKLGHGAPTAPYYLWQSKHDELIPWSSVNQLDKDWCANGAKVRFVTNNTSEHISGVVEMVPTALPWLLARFAGKPFADNCPSR
ncbi:MAG: hypothetical protein JWP74_4038 [Marmoricola sp.]|nr:hypothetical protein [Marmoricola sp.]